MYLYLDDIREPPEGATLCRTADEALRLIETGKVALISFDHDLGEGKTGYDVAKRIEELVAAGKIPMPAWRIHSANPVGRINIEAAMRSANKFSTRLQREWTFENFLTVKSNTAARDAAQDIVTEYLRHCQNRLLCIQGSKQGIGKSHLLHAIGNCLVNERGFKGRVRLIHSLDFRSEYLAALKSGDVEAFLEGFSSLNALLLDDIEYLARSYRNIKPCRVAFRLIIERTLESGGIVACSENTYPDEYPKISANLHSLLLPKGYPCQVQELDFPEPSLLKELLVHWARMRAQTLGQDVIGLLMRECRLTNLREWEGLVNKLIATSRYHNQPITVKLANQVLHPYFRS